MAGSHLQNPSNSNPTGATKKSGQILQKQARSGEISTRSSEISTRSGYIWWDLARFGQTQQFLAKKKMQISKKIQFLERIFQIPVRLFFQISMPFLIPAIDLTLTITENRTDRFFRRLVSGYSAPPPDTGGSSLGWVENRPGPTRGQPYPLQPQVLPLVTLRLHSKVLDLL